MRILICSLVLGGVTAALNVAEAAGSLGGCQLFPNNHIFNTKVTGLEGSAINLSGVSSSTAVHLDAATSAASNGIPYNLLDTASAPPWTSVTLEQPDESDCGNGNSHHAITHDCSANAVAPTMLLPSGTHVEGESASMPGTCPNGGDCHMLVVDTTHCFLWETYASGGSPITAPFSIAFFDLSSNAMRTEGWTSADAAGFPILPLLLRAEEASSGLVTHAMRFTMEATTSNIWPASHAAVRGSGGMHMGTLLRLKAGFTISATAGPQAKAILTALKTYGMYLADNGGNLFIQTDPSSGWDSSTASQVGAAKLADFEIVDPASLKVADNSYEAVGNSPGGGGTGGGSGGVGAPDTGSTSGSTAAGGTVHGCASTMPEMSVLILLLTAFRLESSARRKTARAPKSA